MPEFTDHDKLTCVRREIAFRRRVYAEKVRSGRMPHDQASREIALMEAIAADYTAHTGQGDLLARDPAYAEQPQ